MPSLTPSLTKNKIQPALDFEQDVSIEADKVKFKQILYNLLSNAIKFTGERGQVTTAFSVSDDELVTQVTDTGVGMFTRGSRKVVSTIYATRCLKIPGI